MHSFYVIVSLILTLSHANVVFNIADNTNTMTFGMDVAEIWWSNGFAFPFAQAKYADLRFVSEYDYERNVRMHCKKFTLAAPIPLLTSNQSSGTCRHFWLLHIRASGSQQERHLHFPTQSCERKPGLLPKNTVVAQ
jgi:hypothetical protein